MPDPISHAEMIAWMRAHRKWVEPRDTEMAEAVLAHLERTQWWEIEDRAPKDGRLILIGGPGWWTPARWSEVNYVGVGNPTWITVDGHGTRTPTHYMIPVPPSPETPRCP